MLKSSMIRSTRNTPQRRKAASSTSSLPVNDPVCVTAPRDASSVRPGLMTMIELGQSRLSCRRQEGSSVADRLHIEEDALSMRVVVEVVDQISPADVEHRPDRDEGAETNISSQAPGEHRGTKGPALD